MYLGQTEAIAEERAANPSIVEIGFPPVRVTIPITSEHRAEEAKRWGIGMTLAAVALVYFGGSAIGGVVRELRGS